MYFDQKRTTAHNRLRNKNLAYGLLVTLLLAFSASAAKADDVNARKEQKDSTGTWWDRSFGETAFRNNILYDIAGAVNFGFEVPVSRHWTLGGNVGLKPWPRFYAWEWHKDTQAKWRHILFVPEARYYTRTLKEGHFFGADLLWTHFNTGGVSFPLGMYRDVKQYRIQGDFWGLGLFYGYSWWIGRHFRIEAEAGLAAGYADATKYECRTCGDAVGPKRGAAIVPKLGLNLVYDLYRNPKFDRGHDTTVFIRETDTLLIPSKPSIFLIHLNNVKGPRSLGDVLADSLPFVFPFSRHANLEDLPAPARDSMLYVHFPLDRTELREDFAGNKPILDSIVRITRMLQYDPQIASELISIVGLASIEGSVSHNQDLSDGRAKALKKYVMDRTGVPDKHFETLAKGEAWDWFEQQLRSLPAEENEWVGWAIDIIESESDLDRREALLKADAAKYEQIRSHLLADQRNSGYLRIYYENKPDPGTDLFNDRVIGLIRGKQYKEAVKAIEKDPEIRDKTIRRDPDARNAYGIALFFDAVQRDHLMKMEPGDAFDQKAEDRYQEETAKAIAYIREAAELGSKAAKANLCELDKYNHEREVYRAFMNPQPAKNPAE